MELLYKLICIKPDGEEKLVKGGMSKDRAENLLIRFKCVTFWIQR